MDSNVDNLAMCHVDPNCKFQDHALESCSNKCRRELDISEVLELTRLFIFDDYGKTVEY